MDSKRSQPRRTSQKQQQFPQRLEPIPCSEIQNIQANEKSPSKDSLQKQKAQVSQGGRSKERQHDLSQPEPRASSPINAFKPLPGLYRNPEQGDRLDKPALLWQCDGCQSQGACLHSLLVATHIPPVLLVQSGHYMPVATPREPERFSSQSENVTYLRPPTDCGSREQGLNINTGVKREWTIKDVIKQKQSASATKIQALWRGRAVRRKLPELLEAIAARRLLERKLLDTILEDFVREVVLPDLLVEVLNNTNEIFPTHGVPSYPLLGVYENILDEVIKEMCQECLLELRNDFVQQYLYADRKRKYLTIPDAGRAIVEELVDEVVAEECRFSVKLCLRDLVDSHLRNNHTEEIWEILIDEVLRETTRQLSFELLRHRRYEYVTDLIIGEHAEETLMDICREIETENHIRIPRNRRELQETKVFNRITDKILEKLVLERMLEHVQLGGLSSTLLTEVTDEILSRAILDHILNKQMALTDLKSSLDAQSSVISAAQRILTARAIAERLLIPGVEQECLREWSS